MCGYLLESLLLLTLESLITYLDIGRCKQTHQITLNDDNNNIIASVSIYCSIFVPIVIELVLLLTLVPFMFVNNIIVSLR